RASVTFNLARFNMVAPQGARAEFTHVLSLFPRTTMVRLYSWWADQGDTIPIRDYVNYFAWTAAVRPHDPSTIAMLRADVAAGRAYLALARRDTSAALQQFLATSDTLHSCWFEKRATIVRLLLAAGRYREAASRLQRRWPGTSECSDGVDDVLWTLERARAFERTGRPDRAMND